MSDWSPPPGHGGRWIMACIAGSALGLTLSTAWQAVVLPMVAPGLGGPVGLLLQAVGGAVLGACLGTVQGGVLRRAYRDLPLGAWIGATAAAGYVTALVVALAYAGLMPFAASLPIELFVLIGAVVKGVVGGFAYGVAQGRVLDRVVAERASWVRVVMIGNMLGALLGTMRWLVGTSALTPASVMLGGLLAGAFGGLALGIVTAGAFRFMPPRGAPPAPQ